MERTAVKSSNVAEVGYDGDVLEVTFRNGSRYRYSGVPREVHDELVSAESVGRYLNQNVKGQYGVERVVED